MNLEGIPFASLDFSTVSPTVHPGRMGTATWRTIVLGSVRIRTVEYSSGYVADHWCTRGHVLYVVSGELTTELDDGRLFHAREGGGYIVSAEDGAHRSRTESGARLFIVDEA